MKTRVFAFEFRITVDAVNAYRMATPARADVLEPSPDMLRCRLSLITDGWDLVAEAMVLNQFGERAWRKVENGVGVVSQDGAFHVDAAAIRWIGLARLADLALEGCGVRISGVATVLDLGAL